MSEFNAYFDRIADHQIRERVADNAKLFHDPDRPRRQRRTRGRQAIAHRLHVLADRLDV
jgi:hypothetical protein